MSFPQYCTATAVIDLNVYASFNSADNVKICVVPRGTSVEMLEQREVDDIIFVRLVSPLSGWVRVRRGSGDIDVKSAVAKYLDMSGCDQAQIGMFDPRLLAFEFVSGFMLRRRQCELVKDFVTSAQAGMSCVYQMIMGAGKTTVIGPLLALILADGQRLITQICPSALLEMTRGVLRKVSIAIVKPLNKVAYPTMLSTLWKLWISFVTPRVVVT